MPSSINVPDRGRLVLPCKNRIDMEQFSCKFRCMDVGFDRFRALQARLPADESRRLVVLTGARQTGKTTLAKRLYSELRYLNFDDLELRHFTRSIGASAWPEQVGPAILDEAQKEPGVFDKVKHAFDSGKLDFSLLLGSSRILLMDQVRESLAGRAFVFDLWPLMPHELRSAWGERPARTLFDRLLDQGEDALKVLSQAPGRLLPDEDHELRSAWQHVHDWGGMPELLRLDENSRKEWLRSYLQTFLQRDLSDLARLADLEPFFQLQRLCMLRSGCLLSFARLGRDAGVSARTAKQYLEYLRMSYQVLLLPPYSRNLTSRTVKSPKLIWLDAGIRRQGTGQWGELAGEHFESVVISEAWKWVSTAGLDIQLSYYRTSSGLEVDLLAEGHAGVVAFEIKQRREPASKDLRGLRALAKALGQEFRAGIVVYDGKEICRMDKDLPLFAVPAHRLFA